MSKHVGKKVRKTNVTDGGTDGQTDGVQTYSPSWFHWWGLLNKRPKGPHIVQCVQCANFLTDRPGRPLLFTHHPATSCHNAAVLLWLHNYFVWTNNDWNYCKQLCTLNCFVCLINPLWLIKWYFLYELIRHIAITYCPFWFAFSHLPKCGQLLQQKGRKNFTWNLCARFSWIFRFQQAKPICIVNIRIGLACWDR